MRIAIFLMASFSLLAACAVGPDMLGQTELPTCEIVNVPPNCENAPNSGPNNPVVNFNKNGLALAPPNVCTNAGVTLKFKITPTAIGQNPPGSVAVIPKKGKDTWLTGTNSKDNGVIEIGIPDYLPTNTDYDYTIVSVRDGVVSCVDPRIHVVD